MDKVDTSKVSTPIEQDNKYKECLEWMLKQQYYILHPNIKKKIKEVLNGTN